MAEAEWKTSVEATIKTLLNEKTDISDIKDQLAAFANQLESDLTSQMNDKLAVSLGNLELENRRMREEQENNINETPAPVVIPPNMMQKPPRFSEGEDPESYLMQFELICTSNGWTDQQKCMKLPACLPPSVLPWYVQD